MQLNPHLILEACLQATECPFELQPLNQAVTLPCMHTINEIAAKQLYGELINNACQKPGACIKCQKPVNTYAVNHDIRQLVENTLQLGQAYQRLNEEKQLLEAKLDELSYQSILKEKSKLTGSANKQAYVTIKDFSNPYEIHSLVFSQEIDALQLIIHFKQEDEIRNFIEKEKITADQVHDKSLYIKDKNILNLLPFFFSLPINFLDYSLIEQFLQPLIVDQ